MNGTTAESGTMRYAAREVVGAFPTAGALEKAVEQLEIAGVDRAAISVLGVDAARSGRIDAIYRSAEAIEDDPAARQAAFVSRETQTEGKAFAVSLPLGVGGFAGAWAGPWLRPVVPWSRRSGPPSWAAPSAPAWVPCWFVPSRATMRRLSNPSSPTADWFYGSARPMKWQSSAHSRSSGAAEGLRCTRIPLPENGVWRTRRGTTSSQTHFWSATRDDSARKSR
jgi:hypothetical protein